MQYVQNNTPNLPLASFSHDLKTPLACIIGSLDIYNLLKDTLTEENKESLLYNALNEAKRLNGFITDIMDLANLQGKIDCECVDLDIGQLLRQSTQKIKNNSLRLHEIKIDISAGVIAQVNELWIQRALEILLENAIFCTEDSNKTEISLNSENDSCRIIIRDYGKSLTKKSKAVPFQDSEAKSEEIIIGKNRLGLPICKIIAEMHCGNISIDRPAIGKGNVFTLTLPLQHC
ncbi:MAG: ATP-binding protein [Pseudomonadota bacterium]